MPWVGLEPSIGAFERTKTVHALDRAATAIGSEFIGLLLYRHSLCKFWKYSVRLAYYPLSAHPSFSTEGAIVNQAEN
jgi:hypothetical protein